LEIYNTNATFFSRIPQNKKKERKTRLFDNKVLIESAERLLKIPSEED
jgi:hypothetical protein